MRTPTLQTQWRLGTYLQSFTPRRHLRSTICIWARMALHYEANDTGDYFSKVGLSFTASLWLSFSLCISGEGLGPV